MDRACDLCGGSEPAWDWLTPNQITLVQAEEGMGLYFEDPHWLACDACHALVLQDKEDLLYARAVLNMPIIAEAIFEDPRLRDALEEGQRTEVKRMHEAFWKHKTEYAAIEEA